VSAPGAEILVDGVSVGKAPIAEPVMVNAGRRKVEASLAGSGTATKVVEVAGEDTASVSLDLKTTEDVILDGGSGGRQPDDAGASKGGRVPWIPWAITGGLAVGAGVVGGLALSASSDLRTKLDTFGASRTDIDAARGKTRTLALTTDVLLGLTGAMAVTSVVVTVVSLRSSSADTTQKADGPSVRVGVGPGTVSFSGSF
jgi:hypothetical protein